jgi:hypothetical protein
MRAMYSNAGFAAALESSTQLRGSEDRRLLDSVMLWTAREIGIDFEEGATFNEDPDAALARNQDRVDGLVAAISAAAHLDQFANDPDPPIYPWTDAPRLRPYWGIRHRKLGAGFQRRLAQGGLPTLQRPVRQHDIVVWSKEPQFPRLLAELAPKKALLLEPGTLGQAEQLRVHPSFLAAVDFHQISDAYEH